jgi:hypothetical protein
VYCNKTGQIQVWSSNSSSAPLVDLNRDAAWLRPWVELLVNWVGVRIEIRTHNRIPGYQELWVGNASDPDSSFFVDSFVDDAVLPGGSFLSEGPHVGFFAYCTAGEVGFFNRRIHDVSILTRNRYTANSDGSFTWQLRLQNADGVTADFPVYSVMQQLFMPYVARAWSTPYPSKKDFQQPLLFRSDGRENELALLRHDGLGLRCRTIAARIDGKKNKSSYATLHVNGAVTGSSYMHLNAISEANYPGPPKRAREVELTVRWWPQM